MCGVAFGQDVGTGRGGRGAGAQKGRCINRESQTGPSDGGLGAWTRGRSGRMARAVCGFDDVPVVSSRCAPC